MYDSASRKLVSCYPQTDPILDMPYPEYRLDYHLFPASDNLMLFMICFLCTRGKYLIKATLSVLRYGLYNKAQHLLRSVYTDYSVECIRVPVRKKYGLF